MYEYLKTITRETMKKNRIPTGHRDCCGDMIHEGDTVHTRDGNGRIHWIQEQWWLMFSDLSVKALNKYPASELRRCDNSRVTTNIVTKSGVTTKPIVTGLSHGLSQPEGGQNQDDRCVL